MIALLAVLLLSSTVTAQVADVSLQGAEVQPGQRYTSGTRLKSTDRGVAFTLPPRWDGLLPQGAEALLLVSNTEPGVGIVMAQPAVTVEQVRAGFSAPQDLGDGVVLALSGPIQVQGNVLTGRYRSGQFVGIMRCVVAPTGNALAVIFAGPAPQAAAYQTVIDTLFSSLSFAAPRAERSDDVVSAGDTEEWRQFLAGHKLEFLESYSSSGGGFSGGYSMRRTLHLCRDGSYSSYDSSLVSAGGGGVDGYGSGGGQHTGRWQVQAASSAQATLLLTDSQGQLHRHALGWDDSAQATFLDGERVYRVASDLCP